MLKFFMCSIWVHVYIFVKERYYSHTFTSKYSGLKQFDAIRKEIKNLWAVNRAAVWLLMKIVLLLSHIFWLFGSFLL